MVSEMTAVKFHSCEYCTIFVSSHKNGENRLHLLTFYTVEWLFCLWGCKEVIVQDLTAIELLNQT